MALPADIFTPDLVRNLGEMRETQSWIINLLCPALWQTVIKPNLFKNADINIYLYVVQKNLLGHTALNLTLISVYI